MDSSALKESLDAFFDKYKKHFWLNTVSSILLMSVFLEIWSTLFKIFNNDLSLAMPWYVCNFLLNYSTNTAKINTLLWISFLIPTLLTIFTCASIYNQKRIKHIYGDAHFASMKEIKNMGLLDCKSGLIIGEKYKKILRAPLISHALVLAPSRSGKGVSQVIPNALTFNESMIIADVKDEIFDATSGFRLRHGQLVYSFAPLRQNGKTHRWNPLEHINKNSPRLISDVDLITHTLIYNDGDKESMWVSEARTFLKGLILWLMDSGNPFNMGFLANFIKGTPNFSEDLKKIRDNAINEDGSIKINQTAFTNINNYLNKAEKEQSGVRSTITARLNLWDDPLIQAATQTSDFDFCDIRKKKMTIYLGIPVDQIKRLAPLLNLFIQLFLANMTRILPSKDEPYKVVAILDEFCALGRIDILKEGFGFLAGYHIYLMAIIQNVGQFYDIYGGRDKSDIFFQNTDYKIAFRQNVQTDKEFVSTLCGMYAVKNQTYSFVLPSLRCG